MSMQDMEPHREIQALRREVDDLRAQLDAHQRTTALLVETLSRRVSNAEHSHGVLRSRYDFAESIA